MFAFKQGDKYPLIMGLKWATLRPITHTNKGGKNQILMCERVKGGFATADISEPFIIDLKQFQTPRAKALGVDVILANSLGFDSLEDYFQESYNQNNPSTLRKMYIISNVRPNWVNLPNEFRGLYYGKI